MLFLDWLFKSLICKNLILSAALFSGNKATFAYESDWADAWSWRWPCLRQARKSWLGVGYFSVNTLKISGNKPMHAFKERNMHLALSGRELAAIVFIAILHAGQPALAQAVRPETVASGLQNPWAVAFLPDGRFLVTERPGRLRVVQADGKLGTPVAGLPEIAAGRQGGQLEVRLDADFVRNRSIYFCFSEPAASGNGNSTALARATLSTDDARLEDV